MTTTTACPLSGRELGILELVANGDSNSEIGGKLGISPLTVKSHLARIADTLGMGDRAGLVAIAFRNGWLT